MTPVAKAPAAAAVLGVAVLADQANVAGAMDAGAGALGLQGIGAVGFVASLWVLLLSHRSWLVVDTVIEVIENNTVKTQPMGRF